MNEVDVHIGNTPPQITGRLSNTHGKHVFSYRHNAGEVERGVQANLGLLERLRAKHPEFIGVADEMSGLLGRSN